MAYADVIEPVKIETIVKPASLKFDDRLRNFGIISEGDTSWSIGQVKILTPATYAAEVTANSSLAKKLRGFFAYGGTFVYVVEVGSYDVNSNPISYQVATLESHINSYPLQVYTYLVPSAWYYPAITESAINASALGVKVSPTTISIPSNSSFTLSVATNGEVAAAFAETDASTKISYDSASNTLTTTELAQNGDTFTLQLTFTRDNNTGTPDTLTQDVSITIADTLSSSGSFVQNWSAKRDTSFSVLAKMKTSTKFIITANKQDPQTDAGWLLYKGVSNMFVVYDNSYEELNGLSLPAAMMGVMAGPMYKLSENRKSTPLNNKTLNGIMYEDLGATFNKMLVQTPMSFIGDFGGQTVLYNGLYADGRSWEFSFQMDYMLQAIEQSLKTLLYNSANSSAYVLTYDQMGIDTINATIKSTLLKLQSYGVVTTFAAGYNTSTSQMVQESYINCVDFYSYKAAYPDDYSAGIYGGISFYVLIKGYIKEIQLSITIE